MKNKVQSFDYGNIPVGKYRIVKDVKLSDGRRIYVAGEFRVFF